MSDDRVTWKDWIALYVKGLESAEIARKILMKRKRFTC